MLIFMFVSGKDPFEVIAADVSDWIFLLSKSRNVLCSELRFSPYCKSRAEEIFMPCTFYHCSNLTQLLLARLKSIYHRKLKELRSTSYPLNTSRAPKSYRRDCNSQNCRFFVCADPRSKQIKLPIYLVG